MLRGTDIGMLAAVAVLLTFSGLLALAETGLVRMSKARARSLVEQKARGAQSLARLVEEPESFLAPVLLLVLVCQLVAATLVGVVSDRLFGALGIVIATAFEVVVIFVFFEAVPKQWAVREVDRAALTVAPVVYRLIHFPPIRAVSLLLIGFAHVILRVLFRGDGGEPQPEVTESELLAFADVAVEADVIEHEERVLLSSIIDFGDTIVREVMAPRTDVVAVAAELSVAEAIDRALRENKSRLPVFEQSVDDVVGVVHALDLVEALRHGSAARPVREMMRQAHYVPETKRVAPLLRQMQSEQFQLAVVVDEYGGTAGIVTLEDLVEELVGEIGDELDASEPLVRRLEGGGFVVAGKLGIDEVGDLLHEELPDEDWDTVAGLLLHRFGHLPPEGAATEVGRWRFTAERVVGRRIRLVRIEALPEAAEDQG